jgi:hypothetical protein
LQAVADPQYPNILDYRNVEELQPACAKGVILKEQVL